MYGTEGSGHEALRIGLASWAEHYESYQKAHRGLRASLEVRVGMLVRAQIKGPRQQVLHFVNDYPESFIGKLMASRQQTSTYDLALIGDMRCHSRHNLMIIQRLQLGRLPAPSIADLALGPQKGQPLQSQHRRDSVFPDSLGLRLRLGPHQAVDVEVGVRQERIP